MAVILSLETSTTVCSAALHEDGKTLAFKELHVPQSASSQLTIIIGELLKRCGFEPAILAGVAVSAGPGSFTGLRIGAATAKAMCYALDIPLVSINTLELMAHQVTAKVSDGSLLCPMLDARRMEVYCMVIDREGEVVQPTEARIIDADSFRDRLDRGLITFFGNGSVKCKGVINHANARYIDDIDPVAGSMGEMAYARWRARQWEDLSAYEPFYLKDFVGRK